MQDLHNVFEDKLKKQTILQTEISRVRVVYTTLKSLSLIEKWSRKSHSRTKYIKEIMVYQDSECLLQEISHRDILTFPQ